MDIVEEGDGEVEEDDVEEENRFPDRKESTLLCEPTQSKCTWTFQKSNFV